MLYYSTELYHHGVKDMRWGVRRYQYPDGSLTPAGRARLGYGVRKPKKVKPKQTNTTKKEPVKNGPKKISEMSDQELESYKKRLSLEKDVYDLQSKVRELQPKKVNKGKEFMAKVAKDVVLPTISKMATAYIDKTIKELTSDPNSLDSLKKQLEKVNTQNSLIEAKRKLSNLKNGNASRKAQFDDLDLAVKIKAAQNALDDVPNSDAINAYLKLKQNSKKDNKE